MWFLNNHNLQEFAHGYVGTAVLMQHLKSSKDWLV